MQAVLADPVIAADGHTYERSAMEQWVAAYKTSPGATGQLLTHTHTPGNKHGCQVCRCNPGNVCEMNVGCQPQPGRLPEALSISATC